MLSRLFAPKVKVSAHCDLPCGVYDPAQARIEAESVKAVQEKFQANEDPHFRARAVVIKEQRAELAKHHISVLWSDYFKPPHFEKYPELHQLVNDALKALSAAKASTDPATGQKALDYIAEIDKIFWGPTGLAGRALLRCGDRSGDRFRGCAPLSRGKPPRAANQPARAPS